MVENGVGKEFLYYNGELLAESNPLGNVVSRYILGYGVSAGWNREKSGYHYYHLDEQNSTAYITGGGGEVENRYEYDAFGAIQNSREELPNRILYTGQQYDQTSGQYYLRARFYNPVLGRFVQEDVYRGDGLNLYAYCKNNPVVYYDPSGYGEEKCDKVGGNDSKSGSSSVNDIVDIMKSGNMTADGRNIITQLDENTKVIFRMDVGENAHSMEMYGYSNPVNHINIEIQVKASSGKYKPEWNFHMILDNLGEVSDSFATGIWTKK